MGSFPGGSAWAMVRDIAEGYLQVTVRSFRRLNAGDLHKLTVELEKQLRDIRSEQPPLEDVLALQQRNRKILRLNSAMMMLRAYRQKERM